MAFLPCQSRWVSEPLLEEPHRLGTAEIQMPCGRAGAVKFCRNRNAEPSELQRCFQGKQHGQMAPNHIFMRSEDLQSETFNPEQFYVAYYE